MPDATGGQGIDMYRVIQEYLRGDLQAQDQGFGGVRPLVHQPDIADQRDAMLLEGRVNGRCGGEAYGYGHRCRKLQFFQVRMVLHDGLFSFRFRT